MKNILLKSLLFTSTLFLFLGCANEGTPSGGPKDEIPPMMIGSAPEMNAKNFTKDKIEIEFDELIILEKFNEKFVASPPLKNRPEVKVQGRKLVIKMNNELQENTTYTLDFADAVVDNNEKNPLPGFSFSFSTGDQVDSLKVEGYVLNAENLDPAIGVYVGIYSNFTDTAFTKDVPLRLAKTNERGFFSIKNVAAGSYKVYALEDQNRNYRFDPMGEPVGFLDSLVVPKVEKKWVNDTIWTDSLDEKALAGGDSIFVIDSIIPRLIDYYTPDSLLLKLFTHDFSQQYLVKEERPSRWKFSFFFNDSVTKEPLIKPLNFEAKGKWWIIDPTLRRDTLSYWISDSLVYKRDTLRMAVEYLKTDSSNALVPFSDTIRLIFKDKDKGGKTKRRRKVRAKKEVKEVEFMDIQISVKGKMDVHKDLNLTFGYPVNTLKKEGFHLYKLQDTLQIPVPFKLEPGTRLRNYQLRFKQEPEMTYLFEVDSAAVTSIFGIQNDGFSKKFTVKALEDYSTIIMSPVNFPPLSVIQLLTTKEEVVRQMKVSGSTDLEFKFLKPGSYYLRAFIDKNQNGKWDTGDFFKKQLPEEVFYYYQKVTIRANWDQEVDDWDFNERYVLEQKPRELKKKGTKSRR